MNLDAPEDRVHTLLVQGGVRRPPPRPGGARRDGHGRGDRARRHRRPSSIGGTAPRRWSSPRPGASTTTRSSTPSPSALGERTGGELPAAHRPGGAGAGRGCRARTTPSRPTCASDGAASTRDDDDRWALAVANQILGGGMASRLFQEVREERGLAYSVYSHPTCLRGQRATSPSTAAPRRKRAREALGVIDDVIADAPRRRRHRHRAGGGRGYLEGSMLLGLEDSGGRMGRLGRSLMQRDHITTDRRARRPHPSRHRRRRVPGAPPGARWPPCPGRGGPVRGRRS